ncbi:hypothetical protein V8C35DRAFT_280035 [Trichoderma chlorosporum]
MDSTKEQGPTPDFTFTDDGGRPIFQKGSVRPKFRPNDEVRFYNQGEWTGPYFVSEVENGRYKLVDSQYRKVNNNKWVEETDLELHDPFA